MLKSILLIGAAVVSPAFAACTYEQLQQATTAYVAGRAAGSVDTLAAPVVYSENFKTVDIKSSVISKPLRIDHNRSTHDTTACASFTELIVTDSAHPYVIGTQIHYGEDGAISKVDSIVTDQGDWLFNATGTLYWASREDWGVIPAEKRDTREVIQAAGDAYLDLFNNKNAQVPWGTPCARLEGGSYTGRGAATDSCNVGVPSGVPITNRRYVIDETLGTVDAFVDFASPGGIPDSHEFRIEGGKIRFVHTMSVTG